MIGCGNHWVLTGPGGRNPLPDVGVADVDKRHKKLVVKHKTWLCADESLPGPDEAVAVLYVHLYYRLVNITTTVRSHS